MAHARWGKAGAESDRLLPPSPVPSPRLAHDTLDGCLGSHCLSCFGSLLSESCALAFLSLLYLNVNETISIDWFFIFSLGWASCIFQFSSCVIYIFLSEPLKRTPAMSPLFALVFAEFAERTIMFLSLVESASAVWFMWNLQLLFWQRKKVVACSFEEICHCATRVPVSEKGDALNDLATYIFFGSEGGHACMHLFLPLFFRAGVKLTSDLYIRLVIGIARGIPSAISVVAFIVVAFSVVAQVTLLALRLDCQLSLKWSDCLYLANVLVGLRVTFALSNLFSLLTSFAQGSTPKIPAASVKVAVQLWGILLDICLSMLYFFAQMAVGVCEKDTEDPAEFYSAGRATAVCFLAYQLLNVLFLLFINVRLQRAEKKLG